MAALLMADGGELTVGRRTATMVFGRFEVRLPEGANPQEDDQRVQDGFVCRPSDMPAGKFDLAFVRADAVIDLDAQQSDLETVLDAAQRRVDGDIFFERDIGPAGLGCWAPEIDFTVGDLVDVQLWGKILRLPVTEIEMLADASNPRGWRVHVGGQMLADAQSLRRHNDEILAQIAQEKRQLASVAQRAEAAHKRAEEALSLGQDAKDYATAAGQKAEEAGTKAEEAETTADLATKDITEIKTTQTNRGQLIAGRKYNTPRGKNALDLSTQKGQMAGCHQDGNAIVIDAPGLWQVAAQVNFGAVSSNAVGAFTVTVILETPDKVQVTVFESSGQTGYAETTFCARIVEVPIAGSKLTVHMQVAEQRAIYPDGESTFLQVAQIAGQKEKRS